MNISSNVQVCVTYDYFNIENWKLECKYCGTGETCSSIFCEKAVIVPCTSQTFLGILSKIHA